VGPGDGLNVLGKVPRRDSESRLFATRNLLIILDMLSRLLFNKQEFIFKYLN